jgi:hypothetical protein
MRPDGAGTAFSFFNRPQDGSGPTIQFRKRHCVLRCNDGAIGRSARRAWIARILEYRHASHIARAKAIECRRERRWLAPARDGLASDAAIMEIGSIGP